MKEERAAPTTRSVSGLTAATAPARLLKHTHTCREQELAVGGSHLMRALPKQLPKGLAPTQRTPPRPWRACLSPRGGAQGRKHGASLLAILLAGLPRGRLAVPAALPAAVLACIELRNLVAD